VCVRAYARASVLFGRDGIVDAHMREAQLWNSTQVQIRVGAAEILL
jgi:hypothetical protein